MTRLKRLYAVNDKIPEFMDDWESKRQKTLDSSDK